MKYLRSLTTPSIDTSVASPLPKTEPTAVSPPTMSHQRADFNFSFLLQGVNQPATAAPRSLTDRTAFPLTQLPLLQRLLNDLKPALPKTHGKFDATKGSNTEAGLRAQERKDYIESQTRKIFERRGVDVKDGLGMVGPVGVAARRIGDEEVLALESMVGALDEKNNKSEQTGNGHEADTGEPMEE
jgi:kinetochore protein Mis12/MTW1